MARSRTRWSDVGLVFGGVLLALVGGGIVAGVIFFAQTTRRPPIDAETLCLTESNPPAHTVVLIDQSSEFTRSQTQRVRSVIEEERRRLARHARITILYLNPSEPYESEQHISLCNPGSRDDVNILYEDPEYVQGIWDDAFGRRIDAALETLLVPQSTPSSPIMEAIRGLGFRPDFDDDPGRRLVVVSDMIQNSSLLSQYAEETAWSADPVMVHLRELQLLPDLENVTVRIELLQSPETLPHQTSAFSAFWERYFSESGAKEITGI